MLKTLVYCLIKFFDKICFPQNYFLRFLLKPEVILILSKYPSEGICDLAESGILLNCGEYKRH